MPASRGQPIGFRVAYDLRHATSDERRATASTARRETPAGTIDIAIARGKTRLGREYALVR